MNLDHIALVVSDTDKTASLYRAVFEAELIPLNSESKGLPETTLVIGNVNLVLVSGKQVSKNSDNHIAFKVDSKVFERMQNSLVEYDLEFQVVRGGSSLYFRDYDGYLFEISIEE